MSSVKRAALGRGLADLIPVGGDAPLKNGTAQQTGGDGGAGPLEVAVGLLHPNPKQPRTRFDEAALAELADSIADNGILQPILVRPRAGTSSTTSGYEIVAGERRYRAALKAGLTRVPVVVRQLTDEETLALALIENLIREDIGPLESARAFQRLMDDFGWTQEEMGKRVGKSRPTISNALRLLLLPPEIQESLERGQISEGHARILVGDGAHRNSPEFRAHQNRVFRLAVDRQLSVREVEALIREGAAQAAAASVGANNTVSRETKGASGKRGAGNRGGGGAADDAEAATLSEAEWRDIEDRLRTALGTQVKLTGAAGRGRIEVEFFSADELDGLLTRLGAATR